MTGGSPMTLIILYLENPMENPKMDDMGLPQSSSIFGFSMGFSNIKIIRVMGLPQSSSIFGFSMGFSKYKIIRVMGLPPVIIHFRIFHGIFQQPSSVFGYTPMAMVSFQQGPLSGCAKRGCPKRGEVVAAKCTTSRDSVATTSGMGGEISALFWALQPDVNVEVS